jgi:rhodanese-related sulfurtransferase
MRRPLLHILILLALSLCGAAGTHFFHPAAPAWYLTAAPLAEDEITLTQIHTDFPQGVLWLDARPTAQYTEAHIPDALPLNEEDFDQQLFNLLETLQSNEKPIIIYCGGEQCQASRKIRQRLLESLPLDQVFVLRGGWHPGTPITAPTATPHE